MLGDHFDQLITGDEGQDDACNGQHHVPGEGFNHGEHSRLKAGGLGAHLLGNVSHLRVHIVEQTGKVGHNACRQDAFDPVGNGFVSIQSPSLAEVVDKGLEKVQEENNVGQKLHKTPPFVDEWIKDTAWSTDIQ